ncbi:MAG TPA: Zn-dependent alcohol dehydrogenase, partial [Methylomirabilota bacterium]|nr:Zn-dependent alcohol dehydrogenase [Methylomirabilota bacterium]
MKAAVLYKANTPLEVVDVKQEDPRAGEARVRVKAAGVCHSDWHIMNGDWTLPLPMVLGHEAAGIVEEVGAGVTGVRPGDHVIFSFRPHCGRCLYCSLGRSILCDGHNDTPRWVMFDGTPRLRRRGEGLNQLARIGTFAERVVCPAEQLVPVRRDMPFAQAALVGCCVPTGVGAVTRCAAVEAGASVLVIGCGGVGLNVVQGARLAGAATIVACDLLDSKLAFARQFGATHTVNASTASAVDYARSLTGGRGVDYAFDAMGSESTTLQIVDAVRSGGTAVIVGMAAMSSRAPITPYLMALQEKCLKGTMYGSVRPNLDFPWLVDLYLAGRLKIDELVSRTYALEEINAGFAALRSGQVARG